MSKAEEAADKVKAALQLLASEDADEIIKEPGPEYQVLLVAVQSVCEIIVMALKSNRIRGRRLARMVECVAKLQIVMLQLIHLAYALGIRRGQQRRRLRV